MCLPARGRFACIVFLLRWVRSAIYRSISHFVPSVPVRSCPFIFFVLSDDVISHGGSWKPAVNATFLNTRETQRELQFLSGVTVLSSAELRGPS